MRSKAKKRKTRWVFIAEKETRSGEGKVLFVTLPTRDFGKADDLTQDRPMMLGVLAGPFKNKAAAKKYHKREEARYRQGHGYGGRC